MSAVRPGFARRVLHYLLFGNVFIAGCAVCLLGATSQLIRFPFSPQLGLWIFLATFFLYNFDSLVPAKLRQPVRVSARRAWVQTHRRQLAGGVVLAGVAVIFIFFLFFQSAHFWLVAHLALLSMLYSVPVVPSRRGWIPLRDVPLLKLFLIAYVWSSVTVWLPLLTAGWDIRSGEGWLLFVQRFLFILPLTILFDIRDISRDEDTATPTLPRLLGVNRARLIAGIILGLYLLLVAFAQTGINAMALLLAGGLYALVIAFTRPDRSEYFYAVAADGVLVLPALLLWLLYLL